MPFSSRKIKVGTRASKLALKQVDEVKVLLSKYIDLNQIEIVEITTSGDKILDQTLAKIGGKGLFIKELEEALIQEKIDIAIHSAKDIPPKIHHQTEISAFTPRLDARDCFVSKKFSSIKTLPLNATVGTSSARRRAILLKMRPDLKIVNFRGNVNTRLNKIENEEVDATILAICGLNRLETKNNVKEIIDINQILPAGAQGSLAVQSRKDDHKIFSLISKIDDKKTRICIETERAFLLELGASCSTPVAVYANLENNLLKLQTMILDDDGSEFFTTETKSEFNLESGMQLGFNAAKETKLKASELFNKIVNKNEIF
jgi:hydroxymethylbilane synthase